MCSVTVLNTVHWIQEALIWYQVSVCETQCEVMELTLVGSYKYEVNSEIHIIVLFKKKFYVNNNYWIRCSDA